MSNNPFTKERFLDSLNVSFEERSVWIQLFSLVAVLGGYAYVAWQMWSEGVTALPDYAVTFAVAVALMVVVLIIGHIAVAIASRPEGRDERDRVIMWRAECKSRWVLATGVIAGIACMVVSLPPVLSAHVLLLSLFVSELLKLALQIVYYHCGE